MTNFFQRLRLAWNCRKYFPRIDDLPSDYWTDEDARALSGFLASDPGIKYRKICLSKSTYATDQALQDRSDSKYLDGVAFGLRFNIVNTESLLELSSPSDELMAIAERELEGSFRSVNR